MVFKLCAAALRGAVRNSKGAANFFRQMKYLSFSIEIWLIFQLKAQIPKKIHILMDFSIHFKFLIYFGVPRKFPGLFRGAANQKV